MKNKTSAYSAGFTLIELLVVIAIIGILSSVVLASLNSARAKGRDARRMSDLHNIQLALELYYDKFGTYRVAGTGWGGNGNGWAGYENAGTYTKAVTRGLQEGGFLGAPLVDDPIQNPGYMIYLCENAQVYAISATKENPTNQDIEYIQKTCNGVGSNGTYTRYGKNYAVSNKTY
jgi:prepilin-type N-terminal cleavage/methylation domain-containing protein